LSAAKQASAINTCLRVTFDIHHAKWQPRVVLTQGAQVGSYVIERFIADGGMGAVYEGRHQHLDRRVAIKLIRAELAHDPAVRERFLREAKGTAQMQHPHVVTVYDFGFHDRYPYLVMEYLEGSTLASRLRIGAVDLETFFRVIVPVALGLAAAHDVGVVHRDVKPENIFLATVRDKVIPKVVDFGIAQLSGSTKTERLTGSGLVVGTVEYLAPEQLETTELPDHRADQYALAVVAYGCLAGRRPIEQTTPLDTLVRIRDGKYTRLEELRPDLPPALCAAVHRGMSVKPDHRFADIRRFAAAILESGTEEQRLRWADELGRRHTNVVGFEVPAAAPARISSAAAPTPESAPVRIPVHPTEGAGGAGAASTSEQLAVIERRGPAAAVLAVVAALAGVGALGWFLWEPTSGPVPIATSAPPVPASPLADAGDSATASSVMRAVGGAATSSAASRDSGSEVADAAPEREKASGVPPAPPAAPRKVVRPRVVDAGSTVPDKECVRREGANGRLILDCD
jgi:serine/threonine-protein kinase